MRNKSKYIYIAMGANLRLLSYTNIENLISSTKKRLGNIGVRVVKSSNYWKTNPIPFSNIPKFINCVVKCIIINNKMENPYNLLHYIKCLEYRSGRKKKSYSISRSIDIDILDYKGIILKEKLILPHPRLHLRKFVLEPLKNLEKNWQHPVFKKKADFFITKIKTKQYLKEKL